MRPVSPARRAWEALDRLLFAPIDAGPVGLVRSLVGALAVVVHLALLPELPELLGQGSMQYLPRPFDPLDFSVYDHLADPALLRAVHVALALPLVAFALGVGGRWANLAALVVLLQVNDGNHLILNGGDRLIRLTTLYLLTVPNTRAWSVDAWLARRRGRPLPSTVPVFAFRLIQVQIAWMYFNTGLLKWPGDTWHDGTAAYYALSVADLQRFPTIMDDLLGIWAFAWFTAVLTWVTLGWELLWPVLVLWRPTRRLAIALGLMIHGGIALFVMVPHFSAAATLCYLAHVDPAWVGDHVRRWERRLGLRPAGGGPAPA